MNDLQAEYVRSAAAALQRARAVLLQLETSRTSEDIERVRHGAMHEVEYALRILGFPFERTSETDMRLARYTNTTRVGRLEVELPFADEPDAYAGRTDEQKRRLYEGLVLPRGYAADMLIVDDPVPPTDHLAVLDQVIQNLGQLPQVDLPPEILTGDDRPRGRCYPADDGSCTCGEP